MDDDKISKEDDVKRSAGAPTVDRLENRTLLNQATLLGVLEELPIGIFIADNSGRIVYGNKAGQTIWCGLRYVTPDKYNNYKGYWRDSGKALCSDEWALHRALKNAETSRNEAIEIECFDGTHKIILNSAFPLQDSDGQIRGAFAMNRDITHEDAAAREIKRLAEFPSQNPFPVLQISDNGTVLYFNAAGKDAVDLVGYRDGRLENTRWSGIIESALQTKVTVKEEFQLDDRFMSFSFVPVSDDKINIYGMDISDRKKAEDKLTIEKDHLQSLIDGAKNSHLVYLDRDFNFVHVNKAYASTCGYEPEEMIGKNHFDLYPDEENEAIFTRVRDSGEPFEVHDKPFEFPDQPERGVTYWDWTLTPVKEPDGNVIGLVFSLFETTEQKRTTEAMARTHRLESLGHLAAGIAHDFNNLLGGIYGFIDLARDESISGSAEEYLLQAASTIDRACAITQQLITFSSGGYPHLKLRNIAETVKSAVRTALGDSTIAVQFTIPETVWQCRYDAAQLEQVMHSLVQNALQAMPSGGLILIEIANCKISDDTTSNLARGNYIKISVRDSGTGIPDTVRPHIFDPFFSTKELGRGLGLTTSYSIVARHSGTIEVESNTPNGAVFHVYLPALDDDGSHEVDTPVPKSSRRALLMDDEDVILFTTSHLLKKLNFEVTVAKSGEEAFRAFMAARSAKEPFSIVILDLTIRSGWGGIRTLEEIRKLDTEVPVVVASGYANDPIMADPGAYGFSFSIKKPFNMAQLTALASKLQKNNPDDGLILRQTQPVG